jgi:hypothetical protein
VHVDAAGFNGANALHFARLQHTQKLGLGGQRQFTDFIQEDGPAVRKLEYPRLVVRCAGKGALRVPEQLALEQRLRNRRAKCRSRWTMTGNATSYIEKFHVRLNVTCEGILLALSERGALVQLPRPQLPDRQTTLAIEGDGGDTLHLPARIVRSVPHAQTLARTVHYVAVEFLELPRATAAAVRGIIDRHDAASRTLRLVPHAPDFGAQSASYLQITA